MQQIPVGYLFYIWQCKFPCYSLHISHPLLPSPHVHKSILYVCFSILALQINSSIPFSYIPYICIAAAAAKSLQSCLTLCNHRWQPTRLPHPWDSPGKNTGVGYHKVVWVLATPWTAAYQAPPSMGFSSRIRYLSFSFWLTSLCMIGSRFIHPIRTDHMLPLFFFFFLKRVKFLWVSFAYFIFYSLYVFTLAVLGLHCWMQLSLVAVSRGYPLAVVHGLLSAVASLILEHGLWGEQASVFATHGLSYWGMWDLPGLDIELASLPCKAESTPGPPGKPSVCFVLTASTRYDWHTVGYTHLKSIVW